MSDRHDGALHHVTTERGDVARSPAKWVDVSTNIHSRHHQSEHVWPLARNGTLRTRQERRSVASWDAR